MSIKVEYSNGVFKPIGQIENVESGQIHAVFSDAELRNLNESLCCLEAWGNPLSSGTTRKTPYTTRNIEPPISQWSRSGSKTRHGKLETLCPWD